MIQLWRSSLKLTLVVAASFLEITVAVVVESCRAIEMISSYRFLNPWGKLT